MIPNSMTARTPERSSHPSVRIQLPSFASVHGGTFTMGNDDPDMMEGPASLVFVSTFWCAATATTNAQFDAFISETQRVTTAERNGAPVTWRTFATPERMDHPVVMVSWEDAVAFTEWLSETSGYKFRLPTEAEWEKAARGGLESREYPWGNEPPEMVGANFGRIGRADHPRTVPVRDVPANKLGVHVGGNVWEWVHDWFSFDTYSTDLRADPRGPASGTLRCRRGGAFNNRRGFRLRVSSRNRLHPLATFSNMGFRVVCESNPHEQDSPVAGAPPVRALRVVGSSKTLSATEVDWEQAIQSALLGKSTLQDRAEAVLDVLRPSMEEDHGGVLIASIGNSAIALRMEGTCRRCPKSQMTFSDLAATLHKHMPDLERVDRVEDEPDLGGAE